MSNSSMSNLEESEIKEIIPIENIDIKPSRKKKSKILITILTFLLLTLSTSLIIGSIYIYSYINKNKYNLPFEQFHFTNSLNSYVEYHKFTGITKNKYNLPVTSKALGIYELTTGTPIFEQNADSKLSFASITKLQTVNTMYSLYPSDKNFTIDPVSANVTGSRADVKAGEKISFNDALYGMMLPSGNDIAMTISNDYGYQKFISQMNNLASVIGLNTTRFTNPIGFDDLGNHYSSVRDIFSMSKLYLTKEVNRTVAQTKDYEIKAINSGKTYKIKNTNELLTNPEVKGLKTGTEDDAGQCLVLYIKKGDREYIAILLNSQDRFKEGQGIVDWLKING